MNRLGYWSWDENKMPLFTYTENLPYVKYLENGKKVSLPEDPWFLLGNYKLTMFTHVSGEYELISGERAWVRVNQGSRINSGNNFANIIIDEKKYSLVGMNSLAVKSDITKRSFGCGYAIYETIISDVKITRKLMVNPSLNPQGGNASFFCKVSIENLSDQKKSIFYEEGLGLNYKEIPYQSIPEDEQKVVYSYEKCEDVAFDGKVADKNIAAIQIVANTKDPLLTSDRYEKSLYECFPPVVFLKVLESDSNIDAEGNGSRSEAVAEGNTLKCEVTANIDARKQISFSTLVGFGYKEYQEVVEEAISEWGNDADWPKKMSSAWRKVIPTFYKEANDEYRRELQWHAYNLEAMATYSDYYKETKIPQGTIYDYEWGAHASARDNFQHGLPLVYYNQSLAKSVLRYMLKRTTPFGEIRLIEKGFGYSDNERYFTSDQQLYYFLMLSEYLRVSEDYDFMQEMITPYPARGTEAMSVWDLTKQCFTFLRDTIGRGEHGLVRLMNSDWNDAVYYIEKVPYNLIFFEGESHMNSAMAISILQNLIPQLKKAMEKMIDCDGWKNKQDLEVDEHSYGVLENVNAKAQDNGQANVKASSMKALIDSMILYRSEILKAFMDDMGDRKFPRRMYFNGKPYGDDNMFLEPQGFALQISEFSEDKKKYLYNEIKERLYNNEKIGAREQQNPEFEDEDFDKGSRENGGFWWALNGPVIVGVNQIDKREARVLWENMTLKNLSEKFPEYWSSYWSAADNLESSLIPEEGLPDQSLAYWRIPVYCAHPHAWILYCWYRLCENV